MTTFTLSTTQNRKEENMRNVELAIKCPKCKTTNIHSIPVIPHTIICAECDYIIFENYMVVQE